MSSPRRRSLRLQTVEHNDIETPRTKPISTADIINDSQERTPKSESPEAPVRLQTAKSPVRLPTSNSKSSRFSCLRGQDSHDLADTQIAKRLHWYMRRSTMGKRVGDASRTVLQLTGMWPWEFAAGFLPKKWNINMLEDIRRLLRSVCKSARTNGPGPHTKIVQNFLLGCAKKRDARHPRLQHGDVLDAIDHFSADFYTKREVITPVTTPPVRRRAGQITVRGSDERSGSDESHDDQDEAIEIPDSESEWEDWTGFDFEDHVEPETATVAVKRSRSPSLGALLEKRPRTTGPSNPYHGTSATILQDPAPSSNVCDNRNITVAQDAASQTDILPTQHPRDFADLVDEFEFIESEKQKEFNKVTRSLHEVTTSIQESEANETKLGSEKVEKLCTDVKAYEVEREKIMKGMRFVQEHHEDMAMSADDLEKSIHKYTIRLKECDRLIAQANMDALDELEAIAQKDFDLRAEEKRLKSRGQELLREVKYSAAIKTMMRLGPSGMVTLIAKLETKNVSLIAMAEDIMRQRTVASLGNIFENDGAQEQRQAVE
ncbi:unnamed protein product [Fusarium graminearum]|uniref:Uncharacterized protein n=1 Tax=Gibberella zeae TaxID=5518 RepID=A0A4U9F202_GIBZA|nr:hypothetical protein HG531_004521 [Fusarium graminearum]CAF3448710.1 unnamed protein product [Fusarium graminearum]CAG1983801.1 unnamed protein product [Fusarium graminearum]CAG1991377.1 unnamed protein product [Fusarium graminearum]VTO88725.1 unnamed protein product [Fusarium graminearum]